jgi:hypothetical protein
MLGYVFDDIVHLQCDLHRVPSVPAMLLIRQR